jgi:nucleoside-diphosphate-sugar epimerase
MMRVFVAGATGAIGQQLVPRLVAAGHEVHGMTRSEAKQAMLHELGAVPVVADALDRDR